MKLLLDTHALLWWFGGDERLHVPIRSQIEDADTEVFVSAASAWEVATKVRLGKLAGAAFLAQEFKEQVARQDFRELDITTEHALRAGNLPGGHKDPFDRMLVAQAQAENLVLVSNERIFDSYGVQRLW